LHGPRTHIGVDRAVWGLGTVTSNAFGTAH